MLSEYQKYIFIREILYIYIFIGANPKDLQELSLEQEGEQA